MISIIKILTYLLLSLFPLGVIFRIRLFENVMILPQDLIVGLIFIILLKVEYRNFKKLFFNKFVFFQLLFLTTGILALCLNKVIYQEFNFFVALLYGIRYLAYLSLIGVGKYFKKTSAIDKALFLSGALFTVFGILQYIFYNDLRSLTYLGWDDHLYRLFSTFLDPNYAGVFYVLFAWFLFGKILSTNLEKSYPELITAVFSLISVFLTYSRTAMVSFVVSTVLIFLLLKRYSILFLLLSIFSLFTVLISDISIEGLNPFRTVSTQGRVESLKEAYTISDKSHYLGVGFNAYRYAQLRYNLRSYQGASVSNADAGTDNSLLFVLATSGILGLLFFILSYYFLIKQMLSEKQIVRIVMIGMIITVFTASLFLNVLFYTPILSFFFLVIGLRHVLFKEYK